VKPFLQFLATIALALLIVAAAIVAFFELLSFVR